MNQEIKIVAALFVAGFVTFGCKKQEQAPPPVPVAPPVVTNAPAAGAAKPQEAAILTPEQAKDHIGEDAVVRGKVFGIHISKKGDAFINVGGAHPNAPFTAVCFQGAIPADDLKKLDGKTVSFKGKIKEYNGTVEIVLEAANQISE